MAKAFECEICSKLVPGEPDFLNIEIRTGKGDTSITTSISLSASREDIYEDNYEHWTPDICRECQIEMLKRILNKFIKEK